MARERIPNLEKHGKTYRVHKYVNGKITRWNTGTNDLALALRIKDAVLTGEPLRVNFSKAETLAAMNRVKPATMETLERSALKWRDPKFADVETPLAAIVDEMAEDDGLTLEEIYVDNKLSPRAANYLAIAEAGSQYFIVHLDGADLRQRIQCAEDGRPTHAKAAHAGSLHEIRGGERPGLVGDERRDLSSRSRQPEACAFEGREERGGVDHTGDDSRFLIPSLS